MVRISVATRLTHARNLFIIRLPVDHDAQATRPTRQNGKSIFCRKMGTSSSKGSQSKSGAGEVKATSKHRSVFKLEGRAKKISAKAKQAWIYRAIVSGSALLKQQ
jgi:hypothetical protein